MKRFRFIIPPLIAVAILAVSYLRLTDSYELETLDARFRLRPNPAATKNVVLIEIGDDTLKNLGQWPIQRNFQAVLIKALASAGAKSIIYDIFFSQPREYDEDLENAMREAGNVYLPYVFELDQKRNSRFAVANGYNAKNLERFRAVSKGEGHINIFPDIDGKYRRVPLLVNYEGKWYPYISFLAACDYLGISSGDIKMVPSKYISCGSFNIPVDERSEMIVNFSGKWNEAYDHYSFYDIVQSYMAPAVGAKPILDLKVFKDKICIVGLTATGTVDLHPNPLESLYPAFGIHAEVFNSMLNGHFIRRLSRGMNLAILILLIILIVIATLKTKPLIGLSILALVEIFFRVAGILLFNLYGLWIDLFYPTVTLILLYLSLTLYRYIGEWKHRLLLENELDIAKKIQESFLPKSVPETGGTDIEARMFTAKQVGGDLYDFKIFEGSNLGVMIGDVSGKGVPASLFMAMVTSEFKFLAGLEAAPESVLSKLNSKLAAESTSNLFVTMFYIIFDFKNAAARYSNGGHLPAIRFNSVGESELLDVSDGTPLGLIESDYGGKDIRVNKGDIFIFYTDGVTEAMNSRRELYGVDRLIRTVKSSRHLPSKGILDAIEKDIRLFEPKSKQHDDITVIVIKII